MWHTKVKLLVNSSYVDDQFGSKNDTHVVDMSFFYNVSVLKKHPSKFVGCCLANPAEDRSGVQQLEHLVKEVFSEL